MVREGVGSVSAHSLWLFKVPTPGEANLWATSRQGSWRLKGAESAVERQIIKHHKDSLNNSDCRMHKQPLPSPSTPSSLANNTPSTQEHLDCTSHSLSDKAIADFKKVMRKMSVYVHVCVKEMAGNAKKDFKFQLCCGFTQKLPKLAFQPHWPHTLHRCSGYTSTWIYLSGQWGWKQIYNVISKMSVCFCPMWMIENTPHAIWV